MTRLRDEIDLLHEEIALLRTRLTTYVGQGVALSHMVDDTPIYVNAGDIGGPANIINGGRYEEDNIGVLASFLRDDSVFLDIGANVGIFSLRLAPRLKNFGQIHAFEPHPLMQDLLARNLHLNGLGGTITVHPVGVSDHNGTVAIGYPREHLGGGSVVYGANTEMEIIEADLRTIDDLFGPGFRADVVKIDVEGHELQVLRGMERTIDSSPDMKILFENLGVGNHEVRADLEDFFARKGFALHQVEAGCTLRLMKDGKLGDFVGYVLASRHGQLAEVESRARFSVHPRQLYSVGATLRESSRDRLVAEGHQNQLLFHGPYWYLPRGSWSVKLHGRITGTVLLRVAARFGHRIDDVILDAEHPQRSFVAHHDLPYFECVGYAASPEATVDVERIELIREA